MKAIRTVVAGLLIGCLLAFAQTREVYNIGVTANDGTGDTLRGAFIKAGINESNLFKVLFTNATFTVGRDWTWDFGNAYDWNVDNMVDASIEANENIYITGNHLLQLSGDGTLYLSANTNMAIMTPDMNSGTWTPADVVITNRVLTLVDPTNGFWEAVSLEDLQGGAGITASKLTKWSSAKQLQSSDVSITDVETAVESVAALVALDPSERTAVRTLGYYTPGDDGGAVYRWASGYSGTTNEYGGALAVSGGAWVQQGDEFTSKQFGAKGDGVSDDRLPLRNGLFRWAAATQREGRIAPGVYLVSDTIDIRSNTHISGVGADSVLYAADSHSNIVLLNEDTTNGNTNIALRNFVVDGNRTARSAFSAAGIRIIAATGNWCQDITMDGVLLQETPYHAAQFFNVRNLTIQDCQVNGSNRDGFTIWGNSEFVSVRNNRILNVKDDGIGLNSEAGTAGVGRLLSNVNVSGNFITQDPTSTLGGGIRVAGVLDGIVTGNAISNVFSWGIVVEGGDGSGGGGSLYLMTVDVVTTQQGTSSGGGTNEIATVTLGGDRQSGAGFVLQYDGIETGKIDQGASAATVQSALEALVGIGSGNVSVTGSDGGPYTVEFVGALAATPLYDLEGYVWSISRDVIVSGNVIHTAGDAGSGAGGIAVRSPARRITVSQNAIYEPYQHGISVSGSVVVVTGNQINAGVASSSYGIHCVAPSAVIIGNAIHYSPSAGILLDSGANHIVANNRIVDAGTSASAPGIQVNADGCSVTGNFIRNTRQVGYGIRVINTASRNTITGNTSRGLSRAFAIVDSSTGVNVLVGNTIDTSTQTETLTASGGVLTIPKRQNNEVLSYWAATGDVSLAWSGIKDGDTGTLLVRAASTNVTLTLTDAFAYSPSGSTLTVTGGTNNWSVVAWEARTINSTNVVLVSLGDYSR